MGLFKFKLKKIMKKHKRKTNAIKPTPASQTDDINHPVRIRKKFKSIVLQNGLTVLLISDRGEGSSSASMSVKCGSFSDPPDMQGLAHLIEHIFFCGSTTNRGENVFKEFVEMHGGDVFAKTELEYMGFSFTIDDDHFKAGLEMFANIFNDPLMDIGSFKGEMKTVNSEFETKKYKDSSRMEQLFCHTSSRNHPFNRFPFGNNQSFSAHQPQALRDCALKMFQRYFVASNMNLVLISSETVDELQDLVISCFSKLKRGNKIHYAFPVYNDILWKHGVTHTLESLENSQCMKITWLIPAISPSHSSIRPEQLIFKILCEEGEGSLCFFFKAKQWISAFTACLGHENMFSDVGDCSFCSTAGGQLFTINLDLTINGVINKYEIITCIYQYLQMLRTCGSSSSISALIEDYKLSLKMKYECMDYDRILLGDPVNFSLALAVNMLSFPVQHALSLDYCYDFGDHTAFQDMLRNFTTNNMRIDLLTKSFTEEEETQEEPYYSLKYKEEPIPRHYLEKWETSQSVHFLIRFPQRNSFMPVTSFWNEDETGDVDNRDSDTSEEDDDEETPFQPIIVDVNNKLFYRYKDVKLSTASFIVYMNVSPGVNPHMVSRIYFEMLKDVLSPIIYQGDDAYVNCQLSYRDDSTIEIELYGYAGTFRDFMSSFCEVFRSFVPTLEAFETITEKMLRQFYLTSRDLIAHGKQLLSEFIIEGQFSMNEKFNALKLISFEDLKDFLPKKEQIRMVGLFLGNFSEDDCKQILDLFKPIGEFEIPRKLGTKKELAPNSPYRVSAMPITEIQSNSLAKVYYQMTFEDSESNVISAFLHLLKSMLDDKIYAELRMKQRLAYDLGCEIHNQHGTKGVYIFVVSCDHKPMPLLEKIHGFVASMRHYLANVEEGTFEFYRSRTNIPDESGMSPNLIHDDSCMRGHENAERLVLETMKKEKMIQLYDRLVNENPLIVEVCVGSGI